MIFIYSKQMALPQEEFISLTLLPKQVTDWLGKISTCTNVLQIRKSLKDFSALPVPPELIAQVYTQFLEAIDPAKLDIPESTHGNFLLFFTQKCETFSQFHAVLTLAQPGWIRPSQGSIFEPTAIERLLFGSTQEAQPPLENHLLPLLAQLKRDGFLVAIKSIVEAFLVSPAASSVASTTVVAVAAYSEESDKAVVTKLGPFLKENEVDVIAFLTECEHTRPGMITTSMLNQLMKKCPSFEAFRLITYYARKLEWDDKNVLILSSEITNALHNLPQNSDRGQTALRILDALHKGEVCVGRMPLDLTPMHVGKALKQATTADEFKEMLGYLAGLPLDKDIQKKMTANIGECLRALPQAEASAPTIIQMMTILRAHNASGDPGQAEQTVTILCQAVQKMTTLEDIRALLDLGNMLIWTSDQVKHLSNSIGKCINTLPRTEISGQTALQIIQEITAGRFKIAKIKIQLDPGHINQAIKQASSIDELSDMLACGNHLHWDPANLSQLLAAIGECLNTLPRNDESSQMAVQVVLALANGDITLAGHPLPLNTSILSQAIKQTTSFSDFMTIITQANRLAWDSVAREYLHNAIGECLNTLPRGRTSGQMALQVLHALQEGEVEVQGHSIHPRASLLNQAIKQATSLGEFMEMISLAQSLTWDTSNLGQLDAAIGACLNTLPRLPDTSTTALQLVQALRDGLVQVDGQTIPLCPSLIAQAIKHVTTVDEFVQVLACGDSLTWTATDYRRCTASIGEGFNSLPQTPTSSVFSIAILESVHHGRFTMGNKAVRIRLDIKHGTQALKSTSTLDQFQHIMAMTSTLSNFSKEDRFVGAAIGSMLNYWLSNGPEGLEQAFRLLESPQRWITFRMDHVSLVAKHIATEQEYTRLMALISPHLPLDTDAQYHLLAAVSQNTSLPFSLRIAFYQDHMSALKLTPITVFDELLAHLRTPEDLTRLLDCFPEIPMIDTNASSQFIFKAIKDIPPLLLFYPNDASIESLANQLIDHCKTPLYKFIYLNLILKRLDHGDGTLTAFQNDALKKFGDILFDRYIHLFIALGYPAYTVAKGIAYLDFHNCDFAFTHRALARILSSPEHSRYQLITGRGNHVRAGALPYQMKESVTDYLSTRKEILHILEITPGEGHVDIRLNRQLKRKATRHKVI